MNAHELQVAAIGRRYDELALADEVVAKALKIGELKQLARIEQKLREYLDRTWDQRRTQAAQRARVLTAAGRSPEAIAAGVKKIMNEWHTDVSPRFQRDFERAFKLAKQAGVKKATGKVQGSLAYNTPNATDELEDVEKAKKKPKAEVAVSFELADQEAIKRLNEQNVFWIGEHYDKNVSQSIATVTSETIAETGASRSVAAVAMAERVKDTLGSVITPKGWHGSSMQYFEGLTANAITVARSHGQIRGFAENGVETYEIVNPEDERTCPVCSHMDGKRFTTGQGADQLEKELKADSPDDIRKIHPWYTPAQLLKISPTPGRVSGAKGARDSQGLSKAGFTMPPFHFRCRCAIDIAL